MKLHNTWLRLLSASLLACAIPALAADAIAYPSTRKVDQVDTYFGTKVPDPYRWLEDDNSSETKAWVQAQNAVTNQALAAMPQREPARRIFSALVNYERFGVPFKEGGRYFWTRNDGLQQQAVLFTATSLSAPPRVLLDPNTMSATGTVALTAAVPSRDGKLLVYGVAKAGSDWQIWRVRDVASGQDLPDVVDWVKFSDPVWTADGKGFFYARYDEPKPGMALSGVNEFQKIYYHRLGTAQSADPLVIENRDDKTWRFGTRVSDDGRMLFISVSSNASGRRNGLQLLPLPEGSFAGGKPQVLTMAFDASWTPLVLTGTTLVLRTDKDATNSRLVSVDLRDVLDKPPTAAAWKTLVPETKDAMVGATAVGGRLILRYLRDASTLVRVHGLDGSLQRELPLPGVGTASGFGGRMGESETFFSYTSLITPADIYRLDLASGEISLFKRPKTAFDPEQFETRRAFVTGKDGARFPIFIGHKKGLVLDGSNPTLLYAYGGFNVPNTPGYNVTAASWMQMGGVYVSASIRGGGEYGAAWHEAGTKLQKQNVFNDFIAAAEWLIAQKITSPARLAINGGSNGGLLVGAVLNQRPELFAAAVPQVGVMDMLRFHKFTIGGAWVSDYGSSDDAEQFKALLAYSPLHTIRSGKTYPPVLVTTADHDDRVVPAHSFKYTAALQAADTGPALKLIRIETDAGHGAGKPTSKLIEERGDVLAFIANALRLDVKAPAAAKAAP
jgi:prolyl oligopeptidase